MNKRLLFLGTLLMMFLGLIYAWSLFAAPLEIRFGWSRHQTSTTFSISMVFFCLGSVLSGLLLKKTSLAHVLRLSAFLFLSGFLWASRLSTLNELFLSYGVLCGFGVGLSYNGLLASLPPLFEGKTGKAGGTLLMGMGLGSLFLGALAKNLIEILSISVAFRLLAICFFTLFFTFSFLIKTPEKKNNEQYWNEVDLPLRKTLRTKDFWMIFLWASIASTLGLSVVSNASFIAGEGGISPAFLPWVVGILSLGNGLGRFIFGALGDRWGGKKAMMLSSLFFFSGALLAYYPHLFTLLIGFVLIGMAYGAPSSLSAFLMKKKFGDTYYPQNLSAAILVLIPASLIGPRVAALIYESFGVYRNLFPLIMILSIGALLPVYFLKEDKIARD